MSAFPTCSTWKELNTTHKTVFMFSIIMSVVIVIALIVNGGIAIHCYNNMVRPTNGACLHYAIRTCNVGTIVHNNKSVPMKCIHVINNVTSSAATQIRTSWIVPYMPTAIWNRCINLSSTDGYYWSGCYRSLYTQQYICIPGMQVNVIPDPLIGYNNICADVYTKDTTYNCSVQTNVIFCNTIPLYHINICLI